MRALAVVGSFRLPALGPPFLAAEHAAKRLAFAMKYVDKLGEYWQTGFSRTRFLLPGDRVKESMVLDPAGKTSNPGHLFTPTALTQLIFIRRAND